MINREMDLVQHSLRNLSPLGAKVDLKIVIISVLRLISGIFCTSGPSTLTMLFNSRVIYT